MTYRKSILERMIYLMQLNFAMPVLDYIRVRARKMDQSLSMHFVKRVLEMVSGPYSKKFIEGMGQMIQEIVEVIKKTDTEPIVRAWIGKLLGVDRALWMPVLVVFWRALVYFLVCLLLVFWFRLSLAWVVTVFVEVVDVVMGVWAGPICSFVFIFLCMLICAILRQDAYGRSRTLTRTLSSLSLFFPSLLFFLWRICALGVRACAVFFLVGFLPPSYHPHFVFTFFSVPHYRGSRITTRRCGDAEPSDIRIVVFDT